MLGSCSEECGSWERKLTPEERAKENGGEPVNFIPMGDATDRGTHLWAPSFGLTKRELFAAMAMQGQLSSASECADSSCGGIAKWAVNYADALLAELAKPQEPTP
jgi:hypothetical protein